MSHGVIDTHAHLTFPDYDKDRDEVLQRAWDAGLEAIVTIGSGAGLDGNTKAVEYAVKNENVFATVGLHPHEAKEFDIDEAILFLKRLAEENPEKVVAIGEIGLDYFHKHSPIDVQKNVFIRLLELAYELKLPVAIHDRDAHLDITAVLRSLRAQLTGGIFHCFSGDVALANEVLELGFYIAIPGIVTFENAKTMHEVVRSVPIEKMLLETDCPFLAPSPYRGKRNEPSYVVRVAEEISKLKRLSLEDVARITTINARRAYELPGMMPEGKIAYPIRKSLYINLTNHCTLKCTFCPKQSGNFEVKGHNLQLKHEPSVQDVFRAVGEADGYEEVVFCGFGEPTLRIEVLKAIAERLKENAVRIRLDTDGLANLVHGRNVLPELKGMIDSISISLNAPTAEAYMKICPSKFGEKAFASVIDFIKEAKKYIPEVTATAVTVPGQDIPACEALAKSLGVSFRARTYQDVG